VKELSITKKEKERERESILMLSFVTHTPVVCFKLSCIELKQCKQMCEGKGATLQLTGVVRE
jgi:hypothetical protein